MKQSLILVVFAALGSQPAGSASVIDHRGTHLETVEHHHAASHRTSRIRLRAAAQQASKVVKHASLLQQQLQPAGAAPAPAPFVLPLATAPAVAIPGIPVGLAPAVPPPPPPAVGPSPGNLSKDAVLPSAVEVPFKRGNPKCPCIGFDNIDGDTLVDFDGTEVAYPADLGARCEAWDNGRHPVSCQDGDDPGKGKGWCAQPWCYVDACNCDLPTLPKVSTYMPEASFIGKPLYFSYATCGGSDSFTSEVAEVGLPECRCIGFAGQEGTTEVQIDGESVDYPAEIGGTCEAWDKGLHPECKVQAGEEAPPWCGKSWCFVDPCSCKLEVSPKVSMYLPDSTFQGKPIYYSYATCGNKDEYTANNSKTACVNQKTEEDCVAHSKCGWTGEECLGKEIATACGANADSGKSEWLPSLGRGEPGNTTEQAHSAPQASVATGVTLLLALAM
eukprot:CAMPEP_0178439602 /NCGR_PEP_ID=MMETSP0689_2-20121128/36252_1 /TAXON_ID=160604 /ORGANISM="Amphidinium massartii, Strain CS-259" /LENGTH=444 /DNA_ID=CAMNT_0020062159 /DNA_START=79 /DNA_END=1410 /DNA_ORIENTATION=-